MFDFFLNSGALSISDKLSIGGQVTLLGMGTVFAVLILLWALVEVLHLLLGHPADKKASNSVAAPAPAPTPVAEPASVQTPVESVPAQSTDDLAIIAVITAAISAASGQSPSSFRVVSFKRANNKFSYRK